MKPSHPPPVCVGGPRHLAQTHITWKDPDWTKFSFKVLKALREGAYYRFQKTILTSKLSYAGIQYLRKTMKIFVTHAKDERFVTTIHRINSLLEYL